MIELNDPSTLNAMTPGLLQKLAARLSFAFAARSVRALVLQGAGPHFCTGGRYDKQASTHPSWWAKAHGLCGSGCLLDRIRSAPIFSVSVLHGSSIGGGLLLGLVADHRVATSSAVFRLGVAPYGLSPVVMATRVLPMLLGSRFSTRAYVEDLIVDVRCAEASNVVCRALPSLRAAREYALFRVFVGRRVSWTSAAIEKHGQHFVRETLLNVEASETVNENLSWS